MYHNACTTICVALLTFQAHTPLLFASSLEIACNRNKPTQVRAYTF